MGRYDARECDCGSGELSYWQFDGNGIELCRTCSECHDKRMSRYDPRYLEPYTQGDIDEPIEPEDEY